MASPFTLLCLLMVAVQCAHGKINCNILPRCSLEQDLICGGTEDNQRTYHNYCLFKSQVCTVTKSRNYEMLHEGPCKIVGAPPNHEDRYC